MRTADEQKRRICIYCQTWESGGIEAFLNNLLQHMSLDSMEVDIVVEELRESVFTEALSKLGIKFRELSGSQHRPLKNFFYFAKLMRERSYKVIHLNIFQAVPLVYAILAKWQGVEVRIAHSHNTMLRKSLLRPLKMGIHTVVKLLCANSATDLWACSKAAAEFMYPKQMLQKNGFQFIPNGINFDQFRFNAAEREAVRKKLHIEKAFVIGNIGRLCYQKNQSFLLDVFSAVIQREPNSVLLLVGEGIDQEKLIEKAQRLGIMNQVLFYGVTSNIEKLLWAMDVFAFPSRFEGFGIVSIEAQAAGLPVLISEYVPPEIQISDSVYEVPLSEGVKHWAEQLLLQKDKTTNTTILDAKAKEFDISSIAARIGSCYFG